MPLSKKKKVLKTEKVYESYEVAISSLLGLFAKAMICSSINQGLSLKLY